MKNDHKVNLLVHHFQSRTLDAIFQHRHLVLALSIFRHEIISPTLWDITFEKRIMDLLSGEPGNTMI